MATVLLLSSSAEIVEIDLRQLGTRREYRNVGRCSIQQGTREVAATSTWLDMAYEAWKLTWARSHNVSGTKMPRSPHTACRLGLYNHQHRFGSYPEESQY